MRRWVQAFFSIIFVAALVYLAGGQHERELLAQSAWQPQTFQVTYGGQIHLAGTSGEKIRVWLPVAYSRDGQRILERTINVPSEYKVTRDPVYENEIVHFEINGPIPELIEFSVDYVAQVSPEHYFRENKEKTLEPYLKPSRLMIVDEEVQRRTSQATTGQATLVEKARAIYEYVIQSVTYDKLTPGWGKGDTRRVCLLGKGNCTDYHSLFISMAQAAKIPSRFKIGLPIPDKSEGKIAGYHCWAEFYDPVKGWQPVDASESWKHPDLKEAYFADFSTNKFLLSVGRDVALPGQEDKPVNIFFYPHVEVDGKAVDSSFESNFSFRKITTV